MAGLNKSSTPAAESPQAQAMREVDALGSTQPNHTLTAEQLAIIVERMNENLQQQQQQQTEFAPGS